jgi:hypothetical protein
LEETDKVLTFTDIRDGRTYEAVKLDGRYWMRENLSYKTRGAYCYDMQRSNCEKHGALYPWRIAQDACPKGWRIPAPREWDSLRRSLSFDELSKVFPPSGGMLLEGNKSTGMKSEGYYWAQPPGADPMIVILSMKSRDMQIEKARAGMAVSCRCVME